MTVPSDAVMEELDACAKKITAGERDMFCPECSSHLAVLVHASKPQPA